MKTYTVTLTIDINAENELGAAKVLAKWLKNDAGCFTYDVVDLETKKAVTVDLSEEDTDAVLPNNTICAEDVLNVAYDLGFNPSVGEIKEVLEMYPREQRNDPNANWSLVVEQCLNTLGVERTKQKVK